MTIVVANDHIGLPLKEHMKAFLRNRGDAVLDLGTNTAERVDYPVFAQRAAEAILRGEAALGLLFCGTGVGISIAANKVHGIRAVVCSEPYSAELARRHNDANTLALGALVVGPSLAEMIVETFLTAKYEGGRHQKRVDMLAEIEREGKLRCV